MNSLEASMPISTLNVNAKLNVKVCNESLYLLKIHTDLEASDSFSLIAVEISFVPMHKGAKESKRQPQSYPLLQLISTHDGYHHFSREVGMPCLPGEHVPATLLPQYCLSPREVQLFYFTNKLKYTTIKHFKQNHPQHAQYLSIVV